MFYVHSHWSRWMHVTFDSHSSVYDICPFTRSMVDALTWFACQSIWIYHSQALGA